MGSVSDSVVEKIKKNDQNIFSNHYAVFEIMWKKYGRAWQASDDNIIWRMRFACWMIEATNTHSEYVIRIVCPQQQWLCERTLLLRLPVLLTIGTRQRWLVSFTHRLLYRRCNVPRSHCLGGRVGPRGSLDASGEKKTASLWSSCP